MIAVNNVSKSFEGQSALEDICLQIPKGEIVGLLGANGAGKSTLMRLLSGVLLPDSGEITFGGNRLQENLSLRQDVFFFPDEPVFVQTTTVDELAKLYSLFYPTFDIDVFQRMCENSDIDRKSKLNKLSKGVKRQALFAVAAAIRPKYLFLDEVFDGVDSVAKLTLKEVLQKLSHEYGTTVIVASHNVREIEDLCEHIVLLYKSKLVLFSRLNELREKHEEHLSLEEIFKTELEAFGYAKKTIDFI